MTVKTCKGNGLTAKAVFPNSSYIRHFIPVVMTTLLKAVLQMLSTQASYDRLEYNTRGYEAQLVGVLKEPRCTVRTPGHLLGFGP